MNKALIIVDVQNDFVEGGSLAVTGGKNVASSLADFIRENAKEYTAIVTTQDWHIDPKGHWSDNPDFVSSWPVHCAAESNGAEIVSTLAEALDEISSTNDTTLISVVKGEYGDDYSGFEGHVKNDSETLENALKTLGVTTVEVAGIATDYCVKATAEQAVEAGFETTVLKDFSAGINENTCDILFTTGFSANNINVK